MSAKGFGTDIEGVLEKESRLKGFSDEDLAQSLIRLVSVTHDGASALKQLGEAEDLSRARGIDLATASLAISKADQGKATSLERYGIVLPKVTAAQDALTSEYNAAVAAGAKVTGSLKEQYDAQLKAAKATDQAASDQEANAIILQRFGGAAKVYADTAAGQFSRLQQDAHQLSVAVGSELLGGLAKGAEAVGNFAGSLADNHRFLEVEQDDLHTLGNGFHDLAAVAQTVGPTLIGIASAGAKVVESIGAGPILAVAATYKGIALATGIASKAKALYAKATGDATVADDAEADVAKVVLAATNENTAALQVNTAALNANAAAAAKSTVIYDAYGGTLQKVSLADGEAVVGNEALAASQAEVGATAGGEAAGGIAKFVGALGGFASLGIDAAGGPIVLGLAAIAGTAAYIFTRSSEASKATRDLSSSLSDLASSSKSVPTDQLAVAQARLNLETAKHAVATSTAAHGSLEYQQALLNERQAVIDLNNSLGTLTSDRLAQQKALAEASTAASAVAKATTDDNQQHPIGLAGRAQLAQDISRGGQQARLNADAAASAVEYTAKLREQAITTAGLSPLIRRNLDLLADYTAEVKKVPDSQTIKFFLDNKDAKASIADLLAAEKVFVADQAKIGADAGNAFSAGFGDAVAKTINTATGGPLGRIDNLFSGALAGIGDTLKSGAARDKILKAGALAVKTLREGLTNDQSDLDAIKQQMADQAVQGAEAYTSALTSAKQNFSSIGQSIAADLQTAINQPIIDAGTALQDQSDRLALQFDTAAATIQAKATKLAAETSQFSLAQQERENQFAAENQRIANAEAGIGLRSDQQNLARLRAEVVLPGGKQLSKNRVEAIKELQKYANSTKGVSKASVEDFIDSLDSAFLAVEKDKIGIKTALTPKQAQEQGNLAVSTAKNSIAQAANSAKQQFQTTRLQIKRDVLQIEQDVASARVKIATREIGDLTAAFDAAPSAAALKRVQTRISKIITASGFDAKKAGKDLGGSFIQGFVGELTGLGQQGQALVGAPNQPGGGQIPSIVKPLETLAQQAEQAGSLTRQFRAKQLTVQKATNALLTKIHTTQANAKLAGDLNGGQSKKSRKNVDTGA